MFNPYNFPFQQSAVQPMGGTSNVQYVNNRQSAENFQTQPNQTVILMDSTEDKFYLIKSDASNSKTIQEYAFYPIEKEEVSYVTKKEFEELKGLMESYKPLLDTLKE